MSKHKWGEKDKDDARTCVRAGCNVRKSPTNWWQRKKGGRWYADSFPPCTGTDAPKPKALEWYGDGKLLYLAKRIVVAGITDADKPCYWIAGGSDDETSKPYESLAACMQDAEAEVRRLLREAGVVLP